jgi:diadenosine tetraphosphatase ApaH/serine/threonine PP2A family protein phosphatase
MNKGSVWRTRSGPPAEHVTFVQIEAYSERIGVHHDCRTHGQDPTERLVWLHRPRGCPDARTQVILTRSSVPSAVLIEV